MNKSVFNTNAASTIVEFENDGGSGVIILRTATGVTARFSAGVVVNGTTVSADNTAVAGTVVGGGSTDLTWTVTAAASDTVTFS